MTRVEAFVDQTLTQLIRASGIHKIRFGAAMYHQMEDGITSSWRERFHWLQDGFGIQIAGSTEAQEMQTLIELRNALVHGNGVLTDCQSRDAVDLVVLERSLARVLNVQVENGVLHFSAATAIDSVRVARTFVEKLDSEVRVQPAR